MINPLHKAVAIVGVGAVMPDAPNLPKFWSNIKDGKYSITDVPSSRWEKSLYFDSDRKAPDKAYSTIGGWVKDFDWDPIKWRLPIPPKVGELMDLTQKYAIAASREALLDFDFENKDFDRERTAVILGNAMGGDQHLFSAARALFPEFAESLKGSNGFKNLPVNVRNSIIEEMNAGLPDKFVPLTEDTMPGELSNIAAGRISALFNLRGMNYVTDAACASALAGVSAAVNGLLAHDYDLVVTGGSEANMAPSTFVKFCKIGALSARDSRPYAEGADGFVMGEGAAVFIMKRLEDAERDGDKIYAIFRSVGGSSDGKGKGITAPNPVGQILAVKRAWERVGLSPASVGLIEGHGTSTTVGDAAELQSMIEVYREYGLPVGSIALGSVKGNIGHLKGGAGAAGMIKATMALYEKVLPPSLNFNAPNPNVDFNAVPFKVNTELRPWDLNGKDARRAGVSAFGFGGTNFHVVLEEYIPGKITSEEKKAHFIAETPASGVEDLKKPIRGAYVLGATSKSELLSQLQSIETKVNGGWTPEREVPLEKDLKSNVRLSIDFNDNTELSDKIARALKALKTDKKGMWKVLNAKGIFYGEGKPGKAAFLFTGQGSQYVNMLRELKEQEPIVRRTFEEADEIMTPLLGKALTEYIFIDGSDKDKVAEANHDLKQTEITQPAMLTADTALCRLMMEYGIKPDMVIGHSLGEYGALVASGSLGFKDALLAVSARGHQMAKVKVEDKGTMAAVFASPEKIEEVLKNIDGYVVIANINSYGQSVIGGGTKAVEDAMKALKAAGYHVSALPVSHAFHTEIVAPASGPLREVLADFNLKSPGIPIISNVTGEYYPNGSGVKEQMLDLLSNQVASPVQFVKGINKLYDNGARVFIEMGPKKALNGFVRDIMSDKDGVSNLFTNHPKIGDLESFNQAICGMYAAGLGNGRVENIEAHIPVQSVQASASSLSASMPQVQNPTSMQASQSPANKEDRYMELGKMFVDFLEKADTKMHGGSQGLEQKDIWITGAAMGLPGVEKVFSDDNVKRILRGDQFIQLIPEKFQKKMLEKNVIRLVKTGKGGPRFVTIDKVDELIKLAGMKIDLDIVRDFDFPKERMEALDVVSALAIGAGIDAMRDAGIPMVMNHKKTSTGSKLPDRWLLPEEMRDDTGIIFSSAFGSVNAYTNELTDFFTYKIYKEKLEVLLDIKSKLTLVSGTDSIQRDVNIQINELQQYLEENSFVFDRKFLLKVLTMGHSQFAEYIGARGPNTSMNSACASTTMAVGMAQDWIQAGRCNRVLVIAADDITSEETIEWFASGFVASGVAATDSRVEDAAIPFDRRRHGMIIGMGGASLVVESKEVAQKRGLAPIAEVLGTSFNNSAFHGTRLDIPHIQILMENLIVSAEKKWGINRFDIAPNTVFVSHETYTPARGGSASAEVAALKHVFKENANQIVIANTKGFTGHSMAVGLEDVVAMKILETGIVPPVANFKEVDPELGALNLSKGGKYPVVYALRLAAGFGSQISMNLYRWYQTPGGLRRDPDKLGFEYRIEDNEKWQNWLKSVSGNENPEIEVVKRTLRVKDAYVSNENAKKQSIAISETVTAPIVIEQKPVEEIASVHSTESKVQKEIMDLIANKTGYPVDMLDPELDLEADLGIDTVKQAELFADVRELYNIPQDDSIALSEFPTLKHIIQFVFDKRPDLAEENKIVEESTLPVLPQTPTIEVAKESTGNVIVEEIMALIAEKTGYPPEMLDPDLDLEADLGIDTVKQAELFADIRELYNIPQDDSVDLSAFPTLQHIIQFVYDKRPDLKQSEATTASKTISSTEEVVASTSNVSEGSKVVDEILALIAEKTGYPPEMLDPDLDLEADLGIDTVKQAELFADIRELYGIPQDDSVDLSAFPTLQHIIGFVFDKRPDLKEEVVAPIPAPTPAPVIQEPVIQTSSSPSNVVVEEVLALIADKTGYPPEMLDLDLDLEADLGIDTVKQAELFADIRALYDIPQDDNIELSAFPTLQHILGFVYERRPDLKEEVVAPTPTSTPTPAPVIQEPVIQTSSSPSNAVVEEVLALIADKTGYPPEMLDLDLDLEADLGIDTVKQAELFADIRGLYNIPQDDGIELSEFPTLQHILDFVYDKRPDLKESAILSTETQSPVEEPVVASGGAVVEEVLALIADKTGYPPEMLDLDLDLEADLGIDTVKQAELFADIRGLYNIPQDDNIELSNYPTLNHIIQFVNESRSDAGTDSVSEDTEEAIADNEVISNLAKGDWDAIEQIPRRIPTAMLRPELDLCKKTGVVLEGSRVIVKADKGNIAAALIKLLEKKKVEVLLINDDPDAVELDKRLEEWGAKGKINGVYWLSALDKEGLITEMDYDSWKNATHSRIKLLYHTMRKLELLSMENVFLVSASRLGGRFGYDEKGAIAPLGGAVSGFTKAYKREFPQNLIKVVDFEDSRKTKAFAEILIEETLYDNGIVEVGYAKNKRWTVGIKEEAQLEGEKGMKLGQDTVYLITGGAGSIVSAITADLASANGGIFHLLDLTPEPDRHDEDIQKFESDKEGLKRVLFERLKEAGEKPTPVNVEKLISGIERKHAALSAIQSIENAGGKVHYHSVNLLDNKAVTQVIKKIKKLEEKVDVLLHAGGLEISRFLKDKSPEEFNLVFDVKADGWYNMLSAFGDFPIHSTIVFSSIAGRFGNGGQVDYSAANDFLCKSSSSFKNNRKDTRGISLDWTAWGGIGMAARGSIPLVMKQAGIDMLPPEAGIPFIRKELIAGQGTKEVVVAQSLGMMLKEFDEQGGLDIIKAGKKILGNHITIDKVEAMGLYSGFTVSVELDPKKQAFLFDHEINDVPVFPGVMGIETMTSAAMLFYKDLHVQAVENIEFFAPFKFYKSEPRKVFVKVDFEMKGNEVIAHCELFGMRKLLGQDEAQKTSHFSADVILGTKEVVELKKTETKWTKKPKNAFVLENENIYKVYFHGPAYQVLDKVWKKEDKLIAAFNMQLPDNHNPAAKETFFMPRLIEHCFQVSGIHQLGSEGIMGLPAHVDRFVKYMDWDAKKKVFALAVKEGNAYEISIVDNQGNVYMTVEGYQTAEFPSALDDTLLEPLKKVVG